MGCERRSKAFIFLCLGLVLLSSCGGGSSSVQPSVQNPVPAIQSVLPASMAAGTSGFTLTINGSNFLSTSSLTWKGAQRMFTLVSSSQLTTAISAADLAASGTVQITVANPAPGGGQASTTFTIFAPAAPVVASISPTTVNVGGPAFTLAVMGSNFVQNSVVQLNGVAEPTTYVDNAHLTASIPASAITGTVVGNLPITVATTPPGGGTSNSASILVEYPLPSLTSLSPSSALLGNGAFTLTVNGSKFATGATVFWNNASRVTQFISPTELTASILASDVEGTAGDIDITVENPSPSAGSSNISTFTLENPGTFTFVQKSTCAFANGGTTCSLPVSPNLAPGNLDIFGCVVQGVGKFLTGPIISSVSAGGILVMSKAVMGGQQSAALPAAAYILPSTSAGGTSPILVTISHAVQASGGSGSCYLVEWQPSANGNDVALDNEGALAYKSTNSAIGPNFALSGVNDVLFQMYMSANGFSSPNSVSPPYDTHAQLAALGGTDSAYSTADPSGGNGPTWEMPGTIGVNTYALAFGWNPAACEEQSFIDFSHGTSGNEVDAASLSGATHGWHGGVWTVQTVGNNQLFFSNAASMPIPNPTGRLCGDGVNYPDTSETLGVSITGDGVAGDFQVAKYSWIYNPGGPTSASFNYFSDLAQNDGSLVDCFTLSSDVNTASQTVATVNCYGNDTNRYLRLEAGGCGNGANINVATNTRYNVQILLTPGVQGAATVNVYAYPGPPAGSLIGSSNVSNCPVGLAYGIGVGKSNPSNSQTNGAHIYIDSVKIDFDDTFPIPQ